MSIIFTFLIKTAHAAYQLAVPLPGLTQTSSLADYISVMYEYSIVGVGLLAFLTIVYGGIKYIISAGSVQKQDEAKDMIVQSVTGVIFLLSAVLILRQIDPNLTKIKDVEAPEAPPVATQESPYGNLTGLPGRLLGNIGNFSLPSLKAKIDQEQELANRNVEALGNDINQLQNEYKNISQRGVTETSLFFNALAIKGKDFELYNSLDNAGKIDFLKQSSFYGSNGYIKDSRLWNSLSESDARDTFTSLNDNLERQSYFLTSLAALPTKEKLRDLYLNLSPSVRPSFIAGIYERQNFIDVNNILPQKNRLAFQKAAQQKFPDLSFK